MINVVCAIIRNPQGEVLACQRPEGKLFAGKWEFPGGKIEPGEHPEHALSREILEELSCELSVLRPLDVVTHKYDDFSIRLMPYLCIIKSGKINLREHNAVRWLGIKECCELDWSAADIPIWRALL
tara:strand:+ start:1518 stop:1895 length:378 start_codon:yes stop_codon:yes gene_type:complete